MLTVLTILYVKLLVCIYSIVNEAGASVYSASELAEKDLPAMDPNLRSAG